MSQTEEKKTSELKNRLMFSLKSLLVSLIIANIIFMLIFPVPNFLLLVFNFGIFLFGPIYHIWSYYEYHPNYFNNLINLFFLILVTCPLLWLGLLMLKKVHKFSLIIPIFIWVMAGAYGALLILTFEA
tara:strand:+ start:1943 stop:2326 length:384 start_codon:yes stop_codon:yes gene_type:complete